MGINQDMSYEMKLAQEPASSACVAELSGDVDMAVVSEIRNAFEGVLDAGCRNVVLDLRHVAYADSSALSLLVWLDQQLRPLAGSMVLAGANRDVTRILELSGLVQVAQSVRMSPSVAAALEGLGLAEESDVPLWAEHVEMPADVTALSATRESVSGLVSRLGLADAALFDVKVALGEALANAVRHGSPMNGQSGSIDVIVEAYPDRVVIKIVDQGCGFDGVHACSGDLYASGGRGVMFMRALMDRVDFTPSESGGTIVTLVKHRSALHAD